MDILLIANNVGCNKDGVGVYAQLLYKEFQQDDRVGKINIINGDTEGFSSLKKVISLRMSEAILKAIKDIKKCKYNYVIVEYPFKEYNPIIILLFWLLKKTVRHNNGKLILSLHEYFRAKKLRRVVMRLLVNNADILFVTEKKIQDFFLKRGKEVYVRDIPSNLNVKWDKNEGKIFNKRKFVYFGLIIANKAFYEMLEAWKIFNSKKKYVLDIMTSSEISINDAEMYNINLYIGLNDDSVIEKMKDAAFCILPIKPEVGLYNTTLKTAVAAGCTTVGHFCKELKKEPFSIDIESYNTKDFVEGLEHAVRLSDKQLADNAYDGILFSQKYSHKNTVNQILTYLQ